MKLITYTKGDLLDYFNNGTCDAIAHCCNCQGVMGSGIALQIKNEIPDAYDAYKQFETDNSRGLDLGTISYYLSSFWIDGDEFVKKQGVVNLHAQHLYGCDGSRFVNYEALYNSLLKTRELMIENDMKVLGVPYKMACDRAGGDWRIVETMMTVIFENTDIQILVVEYEA